MDPITVLAGLAASLGAAALETFQRNRAMPEDYVIQDLHEWSDGWRASVLRSPAAIKDVGDFFDVGTEGWWGLVESGGHAVIVLAEVDGDRHALALFQREGNEWKLSAAFGTSYAKVKKHQRERLEKAARALSTQGLSLYFAAPAGGSGGFTFFRVSSAEGVDAIDERMHICARFAFDQGSILYYAQGPGGEEALVGIWPGGTVETAGRDARELSAPFEEAAQAFLEQEHGDDLRRSRMIEDAARAEEIFDLDELEEAAAPFRADEDEEYGAGTDGLYGVIPFVAAGGAAGGAAAAGLSATEIAASLGVSAYLLGLILKSSTRAETWAKGGEDDLWSTESEVWKDTISASQAKLRAQGVDIGPDCAWILNPHTIFMRYAQLFWENATAGGVKLPEEIGAAVNSAVRKSLARFGQAMGTEGAILAGESLPMRAIAEVVSLIGYFADEVLSKNPYAGEDLAAAQRQVAGQLTSCFGGVKSSSIFRKIARWFGRYIGGMALGLRHALSIGGKATVQGTGKILFTVVVASTVTLIVDWMHENHIDEDFFGESLDWWVALFTGVPINQDR